MVVVVAAEAMAATDTAVAAVMVEGLTEEGITSSSNMPLPRLRMEIQGTVTVGTTTAVATGMVSSNLRRLTINRNSSSNTRPHPQPPKVATATVLSPPSSNRTTNKARRSITNNHLRASTPRSTKKSLLPVFCSFCSTCLKTLRVIYLEQIG